MANNKIYSFDDRTGLVHNLIGEETVLLCVSLIKSRSDESVGSGHILRPAQRRSM